MSSPTLNRASRRRGGNFRLILWAASILAVTGVLAVLGAYAWVRHFLAGDEFRALLANQVGATIGAQVEIAPLVWDRLAVRSAKVESTGGTRISRLQVEEPKATVSLDALTSGVWVIDNASIERVVMDLKPAPSPTIATATPDPVDDAPASDALSGLPGWFPTKVSIPRIQIRDTSIRLGQGDMDFRILRSGASLESREDDTWDVALRGGQFRVMPFPGAGIKDKAFDIVEGSLRLTPEIIYVLDSTMKAADGTSLSLHGTMPGPKGSSPLDINTVLQNLPVAQILGPDWSNRVLGRLTVTNRSHGEGDRLLHEGSAELADARFLTPNTPVPDPITAAPAIIGQGWQMVTSTLIPVLGAYTDRTVQFRNLVCDTARCRYRKDGDTMHLTDIVIRSRAMLGVEGTLDIRGRDLDGTLMVGVTRETLSGIPGAESKVFTIERDGLVWTPVKISGTLDAPREDLTRRLMDAAGDRLIEALPGLDQIKATLKILSPPGLEDGPGGLIEQGGKLLDNLLPLPR